MLEERKSGIAYQILYRKTYTEFVKLNLPINANMRLPAFA